MICDIIRIKDPDYNNIPKKYNLFVGIYTPTDIGWNGRIRYLETFNSLLFHNRWYFKTIFTLKDGKWI